MVYKNTSCVPVTQNAYKTHKIVFYEIQFNEIAISFLWGVGLGVGLV